MDLLEEIDLDHGDWLTPNDDSAFAAVSTGLPFVFVSVVDADAGVHLGFMNDDDGETDSVFLDSDEAIELAFALMRAAFILRQVEAL